MTTSTQNSEGSRQSVCSKHTGTVDALSWEGLSKKTRSKNDVLSWEGSRQEFHRLCIIQSTARVLLTLLLHQIKSEKVCHNVAMYHHQQILLYQALLTILTQ